MRHRLCLLVVPLLWMQAVTPARADVKLPALFGDNMVLQSGMPVPVWGEAEPGETVTVALAAQKKTAKADDTGHWQVKLDALESGGPHELTVTAKNTLTLKNVLCGEVWVCSGQSNMGWPVKGATNGKEEAAAANFPRIRLLHVSPRGADTPQRDLKAAWKECSPESAADFSAVAYFFARELHKQRAVPVGLIHASVSGEPIEYFMSRRAFETFPELEGIADKRQAEYEQALKVHTALVAKAKQDGTPAPGEAPKESSAFKQQPGRYFNGMIAPLVPFAIRGVLWYQGEANRGTPIVYRTLFKALIKDWRQQWGQGDFPFLYVQLANFLGRAKTPTESKWAELREAQALALSVPKTGMALSVDTGNGGIHPPNKQDVGRRLALAAQAIAHGKDVVYTGPIYDAMKVEEGKVRLSFKHAGGGLQARGDKLAGFAIAGADRKWVWADAKIDGNTVLVWSDAVAKPVAVRYAWANNPECSLYNKSDLPASPFRTDEWEPGK